MGARRGWIKRLRPLRWLARLVLAGLLVSVCQVLVLRWLDPPLSMVMIAHRVQGGAVDARWRDLDAVAPELAIAVIAAEDQRFASHSGFDFAAIRSAVAQADGHPRGASTLSQQVAKNVFLWNGRSWLRKGLEAWYTVLVELVWPKRRILEVYLNVAEFEEDVYGAEAAAQRLFGKPASALTAGEAARLAAVLPSPRRWSARTPGPYVQRRSAWIQRQVRQLGGDAYLRDCCGP